jgi:signal transduction histidine kinase
MLKIDNVERILDTRIIWIEDQETLLIGRDITEERARQEKLYLTERLASIGEMAAGIAHEINNPLTGIIMLSQLLERSNIPDEVKKDVIDIKSEASRVADVVKNLLAFARKQPPSRQLTQINRIIEDVLRLRQYEQTVNNIEVSLDLAPDLPEIMVDNVQMQQVFLNLVLNAEYSMTQSDKQGRLLIASYVSDGKVVVSISDNGLGIEQENLTKIFQPFFTTKEVGKGTGLGLSLCYGIVKRHGGTISVISEPGKGAKFTVELPINAPEINGGENGE